MHFLWVRCTIHNSLGTMENLYIYKGGSIRIQSDADDNSCFPTAESSKKMLMCNGIMPPQRQTDSQAMHIEGNIFMALRSVWQSQAIKYVTLANYFSRFGISLFVFLLRIPPLFQHAALLQNRCYCFGVNSNLYRLCVCVCVFMMQIRSVATTTTPLYWLE